MAQARSTARALADWRAHDGVLPERLASAFERAILDGRVAHGTRVPSERELAAALEVSRWTIAGAYGLLRGGGWLTSRRGSGSVATLPEGLRHGLLPSDAAMPGDGIDLRRAAPAAPIAAYREAMAAAAEAITPELTTSVSRQSVQRLSAALAERFTRRGLPTRPEEILVTSGTIPGLWLVLAALFPRAPTVLVESPTYALALQAVRQRSGRLASWPVLDGWEVADFERLAREQGVDAAYLIPDFHNPTGRLMPAGTRRDLAEAAARLGVRLIVDETMVDIDLRPTPQPVAALSGVGAVTLGSLSKTVWDGLRVGWIRADAELIERLAAHPMAAQIASPPFEQAVAVELLQRLDEVLVARRAALRARRDHLLGQLEAMAGIHVESAPVGGLCAWATLERRSSARLAVQAAERGVLLDPGGRFAATGGFVRNIRLPFSLPLPLLDDALTRIAPLL